ncbi:hypothetical protein [Microbacterium sp. TPD7012]|uniref:hypothetical protein n=1 Tax=Microbacterium sp. TPD7012 TaxID=2171975 RepID=UPI000D5221B2|nr:hypothetical protein [Microbacterium sp. TPD7012]PVE97193.1 hypothetical protein DC434_07395 [Microbacterium sp. TPD7012]
MTDPGDEQEFTLLHRMNTWGLSSDRPGSLSWEYRGQVWRARRPADGDPPSEVSVRCPQCYETLALRVESVRAMRRRKTILRCAALLLALIGVLAIVSCAAQVGVADDNSLADDIRSSASAGAAISTLLVIASLTAAWTLILTAANQVGVQGHGAGAPAFARHRVQQGPSSPAP